MKIIDAFKAIAQAGDKDQIKLLDYLVSNNCGNDLAEHKIDIFSDIQLTLDRPLENTLDAACFAETLRLKLHQEYGEAFYNSYVESQLGDFVFDSSMAAGIDLEDDEGYCLKASPAEICEYNIGRILSYQMLQVGRPEYGECATLVVPRIESQEKWTHRIDGGSGIVAYICENDPKSLMLYYEGNRFNAGNIGSFEDMAIHAYGRMAKNYPTVAKTIGSASEFVSVGTVNQNGIQAIESESLEAWRAFKPNVPLESESIKMRRLYPRQTSF